MASQTPLDSGTSTAVPIPTNSRQTPQHAKWKEEDYDYVRDLWNEARAAAEYDCYFGHRAASVARWNRWSEIIVAVTASGSVVSGWTLWNFSIPALTLFGTTYANIPIGHYLWAALAALAALVAVIKPIIRPDIAIASNTRLYTDYRALARAFEALIRSIRSRRVIDDDVQERFEKLQERVAAVDQQRPPRLKDGLLRRCRDKVLQDVPVEHLWAPKVPGRHPNVPSGSSPSQ